jgi:uncharacterized membrane protein YccF (DUF307 family)
LFLVAWVFLQITVVASAYAGLCLQLAKYIMWPFGK